MNRYFSLGLAEGFVEDPAGVFDAINESSTDAFHEEIELPHVDRVIGMEKIRDVVMVDQSPIGLSSRSNPASYTKVFSIIRGLLAATPQAKMHGYKAGFFSFNVDGGRCGECRGEGVVTIDMQFLADLYLPCEACHGTRYSRETLRVRYKGKNVHEILNLTIDQGIDFFKKQPSVGKRLQILSDIGLGYLKLGQPSPTLSGGEAQRVKLGAYMGKNAKNTLYVFDEPTTGLHFDDVRKLIGAFNRLVEQGNTVVVVEHNLDLLKCADWIIDLGPEGGMGRGAHCSLRCPRRRSPCIRELYRQVLATTPWGRIEILVACYLSLFHCDFNFVRGVGLQIPKSTLQSRFVFTRLIV